MDDYTAEATELVETYGSSAPSLLVCKLNFSPDFLMKYIIIGSLSLSTCPWYSFHRKELPTGEAGTGKSCLLHHFTNNSCTPRHAPRVAMMPNHCLVKPHSQHTIGVEFSSRTVKLGEKRIKLQVLCYHPLRPNLSTRSSWFSFGTLRDKNDFGP